MNNLKSRAKTWTRQPFRKKKNRNKKQKTKTFLFIIRSEPLIDRKPSIITPTKNVIVTPPTLATSLPYPLQFVFLFLLRGNRSPEDFAVRDAHIKQSTAITEIDFVQLDDWTRPRGRDPWRNHLSRRSHPPMPSSGRLENQVESSKFHVGEGQHWGIDQ